MRRFSKLRASRRPAQRPGQLGFTMIEMLISLLITVIVMVVVLVALDAHSRVAQVQMDVGDLQQSTRVGHRGMSRLVRMAGRGGLPRSEAVAVERDVADGVEIGGQPVEPLTDILTVRGSFTAPIYRADSDDPAVFTRTGATSATLRIDSVTNAGFNQSLKYLESLQPEEAILLTSRQSDTVYTVVELQSIVIGDVVLDIQNQAVPVKRAILTLNWDPGTTEHADRYLLLSSRDPNTGLRAFPTALTSVSSMSVLQEYKFYIRREYAVPGDPTSQPRPKLCRARMFPNTDVIYADDPANAVMDMAENVLDLQVALGIDFDVDGVFEDRDAATGLPLPTDEDEWLGNDPADDPLDPGWDNDGAALQFVRLTTLGHTRGGDRQYISPSIDEVEDHVYGEQTPTSPDEVASRRFRRRLMQNVIDVRNL